MKKQIIDFLFCELTLLFFKKNNINLFYVSKIENKKEIPLTIKYFSTELIAGEIYTVEESGVLEFEINLILNTNNISKEQSFLLKPIKSKIKLTDLNSYFKIKSIFTFERNISIDETNECFLITDRINKEPLFFKTLVKKNIFNITNDFEIRAVSKDKKREIKIESYLIEEYDEHYIVYFNPIFCFRTIFVNKEKIYVPTIYRVSEVLKDVGIDNNSSFFCFVSNEHESVDLNIVYKEKTETINIKTYSDISLIKNKKDSFYLDNNDILKINIITKDIIAVSCYDLRVFNSEFIKQTENVVFTATKKEEFLATDLFESDKIKELSIKNKYIFSSGKFIVDSDGYIFLEEYSNFDLININDNSYKNKYNKNTKTIDYIDEFFYENF